MKARSISERTFARSSFGQLIRQKSRLKNIAAVKNRKKMRQKGVKLCRAIFVATKDSPQKSTANARARKVNIVREDFIECFLEILAIPGYEDNTVEMKRRL